LFGTEFSWHEKRLTSPHVPAARLGCG
jgi:hypothetical protein